MGLTRGIGKSFPAASSGPGKQGAVTQYESAVNRHRAPIVMRPEGGSQGEFIPVRAIDPAPNRRICGQFAGAAPALPPWRQDVAICGIPATLAGLGRDRAGDQAAQRKRAPQRGPSRSGRAAGAAGLQAPRALMR